jgi:hypothetical protein
MLTYIWESLVGVWIPSDPPEEEEEEEEVTESCDKDLWTSSGAEGKEMVFFVADMLVEILVMRLVREMNKVVNAGKNKANDERWLVKSNGLYSSFWPTNLVQHRRWGQPDSVYLKLHRPSSTGPVEVSWCVTNPLDGFALHNFVAWGYAYFIEGVRGPYSWAHVTAWPTNQSIIQVLLFQE